MLVGKIFHKIHFFLFPQDTIKELEINCFPKINYYLKINLFLEKYVYFIVCKKIKCTLVCLSKFYDFFFALIYNQFYIFRNVLISFSNFKSKWFIVNALKFIDPFLTNIIFIIKIFNYFSALESNYIIFQIFRIFLNPWKIIIWIVFEIILYN